MTNTVQPARPIKLKHLIAGSVALLAMLAVMGIPIVYGLRKLGLTHFGGIVESVSFTRASFDPGNPLDFNVGMEQNRGKDRYARAEIRAHMFVEVDGVERKVGEFVEIPAGNSLSCRLADKMAAGGAVNLEAVTFDESLVTAARKAGKVRVVVDEYADGKCVKDAVANVSVPVSFGVYDFSKAVFTSTRKELTSKSKPAKPVIKNGVLKVEWTSLATDTPELLARGIAGVVVNMAETTAGDVHGMRIDLKLLDADACWVNIGALDANLAEARTRLKDKAALQSSLEGRFAIEIRQMPGSAALSKGTVRAASTTKR